MTGKKITAALLCLVLAAAMCLSACSGSSDKSSASAESAGPSATDASTNASNGASSGASSVASSSDSVPASSGKSLAEHGMDLIALIQDMVSDNVYTTIYMGSSQAVMDEIAKLGECDYSAPQAVYKVTVPNLAAFLDATIAANGGANTLSEPLKEYMRSRMILTVASMVNNMYGSAAIAAATICTVAGTFVSDELTENMLYVYVFENAHPILITFFQGEDSTVSATAMPLFAELPGSATADDVKALFSNKGFEIVVEKVDYKP